jgi:hypothetical protein
MMFPNEERKGDTERGGCIDCFFFYKGNLWRIGILNQVSKHGERDDNESMLV